MARKTKEEALETRARILDAAEAVFHDRGVARTSLSDIAGAAGVTRGAIYWHFRGKADLFDAMIQRVMEPMEARLAELQRETADAPLVWIRSLILHFLGCIAADPRCQRVFEIAWHKCEYVGEMAEIRDRHLECGNRYLGIKEDAIRHAQRLGQLSPRVDPRQAAVGLMALVDGLVVSWTMQKQRYPLDRFAAGIVDAYLAGLVATPATEAER